MKVLSIKNPYAALIAYKIKDIENRTWKTNFRGRVLIHSSAKAYPDTRYLLTEEQYEMAASVYGFGTHIFGANGAIIGSVEIVDCVRDHSSVWAEKDCWNWVLDNTVLFKHPIENIKGGLGLWNISGICQFCGCTENHACYSEELDFCRWKDEDKSICSHCSTEELRSDESIIHQIYGDIVN